jgi:uncharacterized protein (TIGR02118 family)
VKEVIVVRITSLHGHPADPAEFDRHYREIHTPIVQRIPGVRNIRFGRVLQTIEDSPPPYYLVSDVYFDDMESLQAAMGSPEMNEALEDVPRFATGGVTILFCEFEDFAPAPDSSESGRDVA